MSFCLAITDADWSLTKDVFSVVGTVFSAIGVLVASYVGINGLATWRRQIRGQNDHELSRRMLIELYKIKKLFFLVRAPSVYPHETCLVGDQKFTRSESDRFKRQQLGFQRRIENLDSAYAALAVSIFEAEALWGVI